MKQTYVSVVGIRSFAEIDQIVDIYNSIECQNKRILSLGFTMSDKHIVNEDSLMVLSVKAKLYHEFFEYLELNYPKIFPVLHFYTKNVKIGFKKLIAYVKSCNAMKKVGIQFNLDKPDYKLELENLKLKLHQNKFILQFNKSYLNKNKPYRTDFSDFIDYALFDCSRGNGIPIDIKQAEIFYKKMKNHYQIVIAGGLNGKRVIPLKLSLNKIDPNFSIDAQSQLQINKRIDIEKVKLYLQNSISISEISIQTEIKQLILQFIKDLEQNSKNERQFGYTASLIRVIINFLKKVVGISELM